MVKIWLVLLMLPLSAFAQLTQGGPPDDQLITDTTVNWKVDDASILRVMDLKAKKMIPSLEKAVSKCIETKNEAVKLKDISDFYQIILKDSLYETLKKISRPLSEDSCTKETFTKMNCLKNEVAQDPLKDFVNTSVAARYLELKMKLSPEDAGSLIKITQDFVKK